MVQCAMDIRDPAIPPGTPRQESFTPKVDRLVAGVFDEGPGYTTYRRNGTTDWLLIHTTGGEGRFGTPRGDLRLLPGQTVLIRPGTTHDYGVEPVLQRWQLQFVHFHPRRDWEPLLAWPEAAPGIGWLDADARTGPRIRAGLDRVVSLSRSLLTRRDFFAMNALEAVLLWADEHIGSPFRLDERLQRAVDLIDKELDGDLSVPRLADVATMSVSHFSHLFTERVGMSPQKYVESRRLELAAQLLDFTGRTVAQVAAAVGYSDPLYFSTRFRKRYSLSPAAYRRRASTSA